MPPAIKKQANAPGPVLGANMATHKDAPTAPPNTPPTTPVPNFPTSTYFAFVHCSSLPVEHASLISSAVAVVLNAIPNGVPCTLSFCMNMAAKFNQSSGLRRGYSGGIWGGFLTLGNGLHSDERLPSDACIFRLKPHAKVKRRKANPCRKNLLICLRRDQYDKCLRHYPPPTPSQRNTGCSLLPITVPST